MMTEQRIRYPARDGVVLAARLIPAAAPSGTLMILLHGAASNGTRWWHYVRHRQINHRQVNHNQLRDHITLVCPDLRGHGDSCWRGPATFEHWCDDLDALITELAPKRVLLVGHCLGAHVATRFAAHLAETQPALLAGLALIEPLPAQALTGKMVWLRRVRFIFRILQVLIHTLNTLGIYRRQLASLDLEILDKAYLNAVKQGPDSRALIKRYGSLRDDLAVTPSAQVVANLLQTLRPLPLDKIQCPTLAILPEGTLMADAQKIKSLLHVIKTLHCQTLPAGHWLPTQQADALCIALDEWVASLERGNAT